MALGNDATGTVPQTSQNYKRLLSPWDAYPYFQLPKETEIPVPIGNPAIQLVQSDPQRVVLGFCSLALTSNTWITTIGNNANGKGMLLQNGVIYTFPQAVYGSMVQVAWYVSASAAIGKVTVLEIALKDWPNSGL